MASSSLDKAAATNIWAPTSCSANPSLAFGKGTLFYPIPYVKAVRRTDLACMRAVKRKDLILH